MRLVRHLLGAGLILIGSAHADSPAPRHSVFKSTDRGLTWTPADAGLPGTARVNALAATSGTLVAGTDDGPFFSNDSGASWTAGPGPSNAPVRVLALAPFRSELYAGTWNQGLMVSYDRGARWDPVRSFPPITVRCFATPPEGLAVGTDSQGVFMSAGPDLGWERRDAGLPAGAQVFALSVLQGRLYAGLYSKGLYFWNGTERRWHPAGPVQPLALASVGSTLVAGHNPGGLRWSADAGATWSEGISFRLPGFGADLDGTPGDLPHQAPIWEMGSGDGLVIAGAASGIYVSEDQGRTWDRAVTGLPKDSPGVSFLVTRDLVLAGITRSAAPGRP